MENSENKSLISTGSSNLAKTEKLLSITQKILSEIKPKYESVRIGNQEWMTRNLDVERFRNGDLIPHVESDKEWDDAGLNGQPAWCYFDNDPENGKKYGKLFNWFAINDIRGLAPEGWHVPTDDEWSILVEYLGGKDIASYKMKSLEGWGWSKRFKDGLKIQNGNGDNSSGLNVLPCSYRITSGHFFNYNAFACFWSATEVDVYFAWDRNLSNDGGVNKCSICEKSFGASVRCLRDY
jgi:uncharacterized protein (TIGR02145 family)